MLKLIIVESPAKCKTISKYLDNSFIVLASYGHIRALAKHINAVNVRDNFKMNFVNLANRQSKLDLLSKALIKSDTIYLATDPDREGEAISWSIVEVLQQALHNKVVKRITFSEITKSAIHFALANAREIDNNLVDAYKARCILDFLVGFHISPILWKALPDAISAGRVQSPALRLVVERDKEIASFIPKEYWSIEITSDIGDLELKVFQGKKIEKFTFISKLQTQQAVSSMQHMSKLPLVITKLETIPSKRSAPLPFTTATLQQSGYKQLNMSIDKVMIVAQKLYEGVLIDQEYCSLITYMRTDSVHIAQEAQKDILSFLQQNFPSQTGSFKQHKQTSRTQEAHEAIRPSNIFLKPHTIKSQLAEDEYRLYELIWQRTLAAHMIPAVYNLTSLTIADPSGEYIFARSASTIQELGWQAIYQEVDYKVDGATPNKIINPNLVVGSNVHIIQLKPKQHFTVAPPKLNEASLVKALEKLGIGRPSTYAYIITTLTNRKYVTKLQKTFSATDLGKDLIQFLGHNFKSCIDYDFTSYMETQLDRIAAGKTSYLDFLFTFWQGLEQHIKQFLLPEPKVCLNCNAPLEARLSNYGWFVACSSYPSCRYKMPMGIKKAAPVHKTTDLPCPSCQQGMVIELINQKNKAVFYGCNRFPKCKFTASSLPDKAKHQD